MTRCCATLIFLVWVLPASGSFGTPAKGVIKSPDSRISNAAQVGVISGVSDVSVLDPSGPRNFRTGLRLEW